MGVQGQLADSVTYLKISAKIIQFECNLYLSKEYVNSYNTRSSMEIIF